MVTFKLFYRVVVQGKIPRARPWFEEESHRARDVLPSRLEAQKGERKNKIKFFSYKWAHLGFAPLFT